MPETYPGVGLGHTTHARARRIGSGWTTTPTGATIGGWATGAGVAAALAPDGVFLMCDIRASSHPHENVGNPTAPFLYAISLMHCMTVSLSQGGVGLGAAWGEQLATAMLHEAGFTSVEVEALDGDFINTYYVARP